jgi:hypothetical protein
MKFRVGENLPAVCAQILGPDMRSASETVDADARKLRHRRELHHLDLPEDKAVRGVVPLAAEHEPRSVPIRPPDAGTVAAPSGRHWSRGTPDEQRVAMIVVKVGAAHLGGADHERVSGGCNLFEAARGT